MSRAGSPRRLLFGAAVVALIGICVVAGTSHWGHATPGGRMLVFLALLPAGITAALAWPRAVSLRVQIAGMLLLSLIVRLALLDHPPGGDINRYLWEGRLIREGESPYARVADAPEWESLRDKYWDGMNHRDLRTVYPPGAQWIFAAVGAVWYHPLALKLVFIAFDLGTIALLLALLRSRAQPLRFAGLYAFNPVSLVGFAGEAHFDVTMVFFVALALLLRERKSHAWSWVALAFAVQVKVVAVILAPLFLRRGGWRTAWIGVAVAVLPFVVYLGDARNWLEGVRHFGAAMAFNGSIHKLVWSALGDRGTASFVCAALLAAWIVFVSLAHADTRRAAFWAFGGLLVLAPTVHFWYLSWVLVFLPLFPSLAWLTLSGGMTLYFLVDREVLAGRDWGLPLWAQSIIWLSFGVLLAREAVIALPGVFKRNTRAPAQPEIHSLSVVIPALNEADTLPGCLASLGRMSPQPLEVIVADGGSTDATRETATRAGAQVLRAPRGRGLQIAAGVRAARGDAVLVVHADSVVEPGCALRVIHALNVNPRSLGGAVGQRFDSDTPKLVVIELLNEFRAIFLGISFGDQGQFFRRAPLVAAGGFPRLPLMEDVEFSIRARSVAPTIHLGGGILSSARRWRRENWLHRIVTVIVMTARYRLHGRDKERIAGELYARYYQQEKGARESR